MENLNESLSCNCPLHWWGNRLMKRIFDIVFSMLFLVTVFPFIWLVVAVMTKCTMPGPVFFVQKRTGWRGRTFNCYKFRSMRVNAEADSLQATRYDRRVTRWGHVLRKTSLDETPQFLNVLLGDMSIVGPRPHMLKHTDMYTELIDGYMLRHLVKPGITGWSQVHGFRGETKKLVAMRNRVKYDFWYIRHWSFSLDLYIIIKTIKTVFGLEKNVF